MREIEFLLDRDEPDTVAFVNAHSLNLAVRDHAYRSALHDCSLVLNDGVGLAIAARLWGSSFPDNLNGTDLSPAVLRMVVDRGLTVFLLGGRPGVAERDAERLPRSFPGLRIVGTHHGYFGPGETEQVVRRIRDSGAQVLFAALGNPRQELFLHRHLPDTGARLGVSVGAFFDIFFGRFPRAPQWMRRLRLEWLHRLRLEPRRLFGRYVIGNPLFLARVVGERVRTLSAWKG
ncbi:UDP-N-acetyl-D-mannosaminuronic acid transferase [Longimycelium tulufanense]|uniref:UDP-N-acetyl-D-mannosaminuronic acid transferase n=1 Tax=Longimycelium tulufanense TaxID=907463 RepID=A0A8J3CAI3_9PSEU|nr:UDP-N-acetyl-D-mannosaminuronic acid transferase [Longimycelium tulufanense]